MEILITTKEMFPLHFTHEGNIEFPKSCWGENNMMVNVHFVCSFTYFCTLIIYK